ncbi:hypothetical protein A3A50_02140 [Candidatus Woesebacteria bacterium RIFCSPLOWO2_01_FULL_38_20]|nr:MAG: hypothetical protein A3A50_02140 [Candidatus Woesebacteria bacterium RIFCSPLOWO2_01_FULL_38_20]
MSSKKIAFFVLWLIVLSVGPITVIKNTPIDQFKTNSLITINFLQRSVGLMAYTMIFFQIILGAFMNKWIEKLGGWIFRFHLNEGALAYLIILSHPLLLVLYNFKAKGLVDPFYVFTDFCLLCKDKTEYFHTLGRVSFWMVTVAVAAAKFRTHPLLQRHWRKFHILNYIVFLLVSVHGFLVGSDFRTPPFGYLFPLMIIAATTAFWYRRIYSE